jgi:hypothetical protein
MAEPQKSGSEQQSQTASLLMFFKAVSTHSAYHGLLARSPESRSKNQDFVTVCRRIEKVWNVDFDCSTSLVTLTDYVLAYIALQSVSLQMQLVVEFSPPLSRSTLCAHSIRPVKVDVRLTQYTQAAELSQRR